MFGGVFVGWYEEGREGGGGGWGGGREGRLLMCMVFVWGWGGVLYYYNKQ